MKLDSLSYTRFIYIRVAHQKFLSITHQWTCTHPLPFANHINFIFKMAHSTLINYLSFLGILWKIEHMHELEDHQTKVPFNKGIN